MKKVFALSLVAVFCLAVVAVAGDDKMAGKGAPAMEGTISKVDMAGKMMTVKDSAGKDHMVYWNDKTKVAGDEMKLTGEVVGRDRTFEMTAKRAK